MNEPQNQPSLLDPSYTCPGCHGTGWETDPETGLERRCRVCQGARVVEWDPDDTSEFGF
jgi:hypothetical protein